MTNGDALKWRRSLERAAYSANAQPTDYAPVMVEDIRSALDTIEALTVQVDALAKANESLAKELRTPGC